MVSAKRGTHHRAILHRAAHHRVDDKSDRVAQQLSDRILHSRQLTRSEHLQLASILLSASISYDNRTRINHIFDLMRRGDLALID